ncbi:2-succinyl-5-enolpyruvyl-6-hydroxy-3-cyclohexene-1-carboxylic-acid synthase [Anaerolineae bacterium CFX9]|nr:2-succinyl-5-enolpyruvyl-6-hydroxy-3-cyclohexene-1-carboxylic-acid synthase [Anaerolineae bacterium CFX9]
MDAPNRNLLWAQIVVDELARCGLRDVVIAPGSRSTPLAIAFAGHDLIRVYSQIDERSAAFFALGMANAAERPVAVLCSSGTAAANFYPAVIEARYAQVPLLILTADRPHELRESGANQTVDQVKLYGDHALWSVDVALPESDPSPTLIRSLRTLACRAYAAADGAPKGAVHLNFPFRKPLEPLPVPTDRTDVEAGRADSRPYTTLLRGITMPSFQQVEPVVRLMGQTSRGIIVCGPRSPRGDFSAAVKRLSAVTGYPILADPLSGVRFQMGGEGIILGAYDTFLAQTPGWEPPELILHFGALPTSQRLEDYLNGVPDASRIMISGDGSWFDANHRIDFHLTCDPTSLCLSVINWLSREGYHPDRGWGARWMNAEETTWAALSQAVPTQFLDGGIIAHALKHLPDGTFVYAANSLPVRHLDQFGAPSGKNLRVFCNRGASGIDGTISSAAGASVAAAEEGKRLILISGDLAFYHDLNGLMGIHRLGLAPIMIVLNNDGGGIFNRLPIHQFDPPFTELFLTSHGIDFQHAAAMYHIDYAQVSDYAAFETEFQRALRVNRAAIIEVKTNSRDDLERRGLLIEQVKSRLSAGV